MSAAVPVNLTLTCAAHSSICIATEITSDCCITGGMDSMVHIWDVE